MLALWVFAALAYSNSFGTALIFDSNSAILQDSRVWSATSDNVHAIVTQDYWYPTKSTESYRPLTKLSYLFNYAVLGSGARPAGYHALNLGLHAINMCLVYLLGLLLLREFGPAFALAALWGLHPVLTEAVTNIVGRADLLASFGVLAALMCHIQAAATSGRQRTVWLAGLAAVATIGIFSKESAVVLPGVMLIFDLARKDAPPWRARLAGYAALVLPFGAYFLIRSRVLSALYQTNAGAFAFAQNPLVGADFFTGRLTAVKVMFQYIALWLWPADLSCDYSYNQIPLLSGGFHNPRAWLMMAGLLIAAAAIPIFYRTKKAAAFFIALFFIAIAPTANLALLITTIMGERFLYLPSIGLAGCAVLAIYAAGDWIAARSPSRGMAAPIAVGLICVAFAGRTYARNADWSDEHSLWASALQAAPNSYMSHLGMALTLMSSRSADPARIDHEMERSLQILDPLPDDRNLVMPYAEAGLWYRVRGDNLPSIEGRDLWYRQALALLLRGKRIDEALSQAIRAKNAQLGHPLHYYGPMPTLYLDLGRVYLRLGEPRQAMDALEYGRMLSSQPEFSEELANAWQAAGDRGKAVIALQEGLLLTPDHSRTISQLVALYQQADPSGCAVVNAGRRQTLNPNCPLVRSDTCVAARNVADLYIRTDRPAESAAVQDGIMRDLGCPAAVRR